MRACASLPESKAKRKLYYQANQPHIRAQRKERFDSVKNREECRQYRNDHAAALNQRRRAARPAHKAQDPDKFQRQHAAWRKTTTGKASTAAAYYRRKAMKNAVFTCNSSKQNKDPREWFISREIDPLRFLKPLHP
jgi:1,4-alpha-glucan branching enzyme